MSFFKKFIKTAGVSLVIVTFLGISLTLSLVPRRETQVKAQSAQDFYSISSPTFNWIDITDGTNANVVNDDSSQIINIPFTFKFFNQNYNSFRVSDNGFIDFDTGSNNNPYSYNQLPDTQFADFMPVYWSDLDITGGGNPADSGTIYYKTIGTAPNRQFVVSWEQVPLYNFGSLKNTFQAIFYEGSNDILYQYNTLSASNFYTAGIQNGTRFIQINSGGDQVSNNSAYLFTYQTPLTVTYDVSQTTYSWIDATDGTDTGLADDDGSVNINIPFAFNFYGSNFSSLRASSNGFIDFNTSNSSNIYQNTSLPNNNTNNWILPLWTDLDMRFGGNLYYKTIGSAPNRQFVLQWNQVERRDIQDSNTFQVILEESTNNIIFQYNQIATKLDQTIGIQNSDGSDFEQISFDQDNFSDGSAYLFTYQSSGGNNNPAITGGDITSASCSPTSGNVGTTVTCTANFAAGVSGTVSFSTSPNVGSCVTGNISALQTTISCNINMNAVASANVTATASGGGSVTAGTLNITAIPNYYTLTTPTYSWIDATDGTNANITGNNTDSTVINLPFTFYFYRSPFTQIRLGSNGFADFNTDLNNANSGENNSDNESLPTSSVSGFRIMPYWTAMNGSQGGNVFYKTIGTAPNRKFVVEWNSFPGFASENRTIQMILEETTNSVVFQYNDLPPVSDLQTVGIQGIRSNDAQQISFNQDNLAEQTAYKFTPPTPPFVFDETFNTPRVGGYYSTSGNIMDIAKQSDGKIIAVGEFVLRDQNNDVVPNTQGIVRFNSDGSHDTSFNRAINPFDCYNALVQSDDKVLVICDNLSKIHRLNSDGTLDTAFAANVTTLNPSNSGSKFQTIKLQNDGKILLGGDNLFIRLNSDGTTDSSFANNITNSQIYLTHIEVQSGGKLIVSYTDFSGFQNITYVVKVNSDGSLDNSFTPASAIFGVVEAIVTQPDGKILVGGSFESMAGSQRSLVRLNSNGTRDTSFGTDWTSGFTEQNDGTQPGYVNTIFLEQGGKILVGGRFTDFNDTGKSNMMVRLNTDGSQDTDFMYENLYGFNGKINAIVEYSESQILVAGEFNSYLSNFVFEKPRNSLVRMSTDSMSSNQPEEDTTANLTIGQVDRGSYVEVSVCIQSTGISFRLADASTWIDYDGTAYTTRQINDIGRFSGTSGYASLALDSTLDTPTTDTLSVRVDYTGDGFTPGSEGLVVSDSSELVGSFHMTKSGANAPQVALNSLGTAYYSVEGGLVPITLQTQFVSYNCHATVLSQSDIGNSTNCTNVYDVTVPDNYTCDFSLSGNSYNEYRTVNSFKAITGEGAAPNVLAGSESDECSIVFNGESNVYFSCGNIKTVGNSDNYADGGINNVLIFIDSVYSNAQDRGDVNIIIPLSQANIRFYLSGAYRVPEGDMRTNLRAVNIVPTSQPYNTGPWNYNGSETVSGNINADVVDWVLIEVRDTNSNLIQTRAALLRNDGQVLDPSTQTPGLLLDNINDTTSVRFVIRHRNHLAFASDNAIILKPGNTNPSSDFTTNNNVRSANQTMLATGIYGMRAANTNGDAQIIAGDRVAARLGNESLNIYINRDLNLDGLVNSTDRNMSRLAQEAFADLGI